MKRFIATAALLLVALSATAQDMPNGRFAKLPGMQLAGMITREANGIPHVFAFTKHDMHFLNGWLHAQDRLWEMDTTRRTAKGTLAELLGTPALSTDIQLRTLGLGRAAEATLPTISADAKAALQAYTDGVNAYAATHALPPEYALLEITKFDPWTPTDSLAVGKLLAFGLSFDYDTNATVALLTYQGVGKVVGFDGAALYNDVWRLAPFTSAATIPDATGSGGKLPIVTAEALKTVPEWLANSDTSYINPATLDLLQKYNQRVREDPVLAATLDPERHAGSNEWAIAPKNSTTGNALLANDPHLSLGAPSTFYPISLHAGSTNVAGMGFPGAPFVIQGQNQRIAWGSTVHPMDVTDWYQESIVPDASSPSGLSSIYKGAKEAIVPIPQTFRVNNPGNGIKDDLTVVPASASVPAAVLLVPRHGPIVSLDTKNGVAVSVQYTGFYPTHELEAFMLADDAQTVDQFKAALQLFDVGSQNFSYADVDGNIAYFTSAEMPIREDLQAGKVAGLPPFFLRNGTGGNEWMAVKNPQPNQALPYEILPYSEMPQVVNPSNGFFVNANNDPIGQSLDGDPLNMTRPGGGIYYLNPSYDGFRAGRITQMVRQKLSGGGKISPTDMKQMQGDTVLIDAEVFVPFITTALANAKATGANATLAALGSSPAVQAAVALLAGWDFSTPTGIDNGYDASWVKAVGAAPSQTQINNSAAATIYAMWRGRFMANTVETVLSAMTLPLPDVQLELSTLRFQLENFSVTHDKGLLSGIDLFNVPTVSDPAARRDILILKSVADALTLLQSDEFAPAFNKSANLTDYRWGKLHRIVFSHITGFSIFSPGAPYGPLPLPTFLNLPGVARQGGFSTVDAASHNVRATTLNGFMFSSGPNRRYVGDFAKSGIIGQSALPGGVSGVANDPFSTNLLMQWLTNDTFPVINDAPSTIPWMR
jgi:penicillin G amidase